MSSLADQKCVPCRGGVPPLEGEALAKLAKQVPDWKVVEGKRLTKTYPFPDFQKLPGAPAASGTRPDYHGQPGCPALNWQHPGYESQPCVKSLSFVV